MIPTANAWRAAALVLLIALFGLALSLELEHAQQRSTSRVASESQQRQRLLAELSATLAQAEAAQRSFLLNRASTEIRSYQAARAHVEPTLGRYAELLHAQAGAAAAPQRQALARLRTLIATRLGELDSAFNVPSQTISSAPTPPPSAATSDAIRSAAPPVSTSAQSAASAPRPTSPHPASASSPTQSTALQISHSIAGLSVSERTLSTEADRQGAHLQALTQGEIAALLAISIALLGLGATLLLRPQAVATERASGKDESARRINELAALSRRLQQVTEKEKAQLARSLHDELGGLLIAVKMDTSWLHKRWSNPTEEVEARWERVFKVLDEGVDFKRRVVENLRPTLLDNMGLLAALRWVTQDTCARAGLSYTEGYPEDEPLLAEEVSILAFRLVQEALTNVVKHAHATDVRIEIGNSDRQLTVLVEDNGVGIEHHPSSSTAVHGLALMQLRVTSLGGTLETSSGERGGTVVQARLPSQGISASTRTAAADRPAASRRASGI